MYCFSYCRAKNYNIEKILKSGGTLFEDAVYIKEQNADVFIFQFGCICIWHIEENVSSILEKFKDFEIASISEQTSDTIDYLIDPSVDSTFIDEENNQIILESDDTAIKLSISYALAQSVKLETLERTSMKLFEEITPLQSELASRGFVSLSKKELSKKIGILFNTRYLINLDTDILDTPEFFWRRPRYEPIYKITAEFQDLDFRQKILNHRLNMIHEMYIMLSNELNYRHSTRLEWIIIFLIAMEVFLSILFNH